MYNILYVILLFVFIKNCVKCDINVTDPLFKDLPPVFQIDDDQACEEQGKLYCKMSITLQPRSSGSKSLYWKVIEKTIQDSKFYNHNELFHAKCVNDFCPRKIMEDGQLDMQNKLSECYGVKYKHLGLKFSINEINCGKSDYHQFMPGFVDLAVLLCTVTYVAVIIFATYRDYRRNFGENEKTGQLMFDHPWVSAFSVIANWKKLCAINERSDFQKLKFIQGIRFYNMLLIIFCHTVSSYIGGYIRNTDYFELAHRSQIRLSIATLFVFLVQTFFLISAFLLSYHVCQTMEVYKESRWKYAFLTFLNRYLRILPPVFVMIIFSSTVWLPHIFQGPIKEIYSDKEYQRCQKNWWTNLIFINNHYNEDEMCYFLTWYLAADTQLYLVSLAILLIIWKFRQNSKVILAVATAIGIIMPTVICYKHGLDIIYRITPENSKNDNFRSFKFNAIYTSTFTNMASYMVGLSMGCFYFTLGRSNIFTKYHQFISMSLFSFLPITIVLISSQDYSRNVSIILSGLVKPCYALGIGAGILAMSQQKNGIIKKICELKPVLFLGNFTYSTYVVQYGIVFYRTTAAREPLFVSDYVLVTSFVKDAVLSIFCGFCMHILVEMPALQLQKMYIPQIRQNVFSKRCAKPQDVSK